MPSVLTVWTIGHSTRSLAELTELLQAHRILLLADVRTAPSSRRMPHFTKAMLEQELPGRGIAYRHLPGLGGLRRPAPGSTNLGWRSASFRGYADYMERPEFAAELERLLALAGEQWLALMCAEAVPWRCHRSLIADALVARGAEVCHIAGRSQTVPHRLTSFAVVTDSLVRYPGPATLGL